MRVSTNRGTAVLVLFMHDYCLPLLPFIELGAHSGNKCVILSSLKMVVKVIIVL